MSSDSLPFAMPLSRLATDAGEVTALYRELRGPVLCYLVCLGLSRDEAQDVVQETFLSLHRHLTAGGGQNNIRGWVFRVAHNQARNRQGSYHRRFGEPLDPHLDSIPDETTPERVILEKEKFAAWKMRLLPSKIRNAIASCSAPQACATEKLARRSAFPRPPSATPWNAPLED